MTGVSTGALIAPFAFLGPAYDAALERFYTTIGKKDVMVSRGLRLGRAAASRSRFRRRCCTSSAAC